MTQTKTALTIAGSDSGGGAGIQADLKTFSALGVFGTSAITAITAQNTCAVSSVQMVGLPMLAAQIAAVLADIPPDSVKIGMLGQAAGVVTVADALAACSAPLVLDPVMVAKSGAMLLQDDAVAALVARLLPRATLLTPNLPEAARLLHTTCARTTAEAAAQGRALLALGPAAVLMKGGHAVGAVCTDLLISADGVIELSAPRIATRNTHGTGCTLSAAIAAELALGQALPAAVARAHGWLQRAIAAADRLAIGRGHGPVHHFHAVWP
ncbi:bifunctional hydroxymethylpyrimidine kinase/phosphomethylpyrimidine kinase [Fertoebacter nigrum]|uniref:hydroxymethylpyrimidine kinase n=1 Tax=Fertoeibacter niger TaxID=2656921 RepID=A0A8X8KPW9_9RHOB|nr:bifunctional hydroxymethylpyrimidine kinase/phosphomethylpyrimidine kinase [Fertoeibacter niger]NUB45555.1 bifunctional hydroxymethylpyrimidine kinase/phosphomethylpyrimidine kinase [Fertoeibacter niger]